MLMFIELVTRAGIHNSIAISQIMSFRQYEGGVKVYTVSGDFYTFENTSYDQLKFLLGIAAKDTK